MIIRHIKNILFIFILLFNGCKYFPPTKESPIEWNNQTENMIISHIMNDPDDIKMSTLRDKYSLENLKSISEYETLKNIVKWTHDQWSHNGNNLPSNPDPLTILEEASEGQNFRCVEYGIIAAACAQSLGMPARVLSLKRKDAETAEYNAGHVLAEVWVDEYKKWVIVDPQWDAIPELDGIPLNAVEFQQNISLYGSGLSIQSSSIIRRRSYIKWISPYLFYFQVKINQTLSSDPAKKGKEQIMLVPKGAKKPTIFQRKYPIENCIYISNPDTFYPSYDKR